MQREGAERCSRGIGQQKSSASYLPTVVRACVCLCVGTIGTSRPSGLAYLSCMRTIHENRCIPPEAETEPDAISGPLGGVRGQAGRPVSRCRV